MCMDIVIGRNDILFNLNKLKKSLSNSLVGKSCNKNYTIDTTILRINTNVYLKY